MTTQPETQAGRELLGIFRCRGEPMSAALLGTSELTKETE
jgi:hypothetical protein